MTNTTYISFGVQYSHEEHPFLPWVHPDGYLAIVNVPNEDIRINVAFALTRGKHSFDYNDDEMNDPDFRNHFPLGALRTVDGAQGGLNRRLEEIYASTLAAEEFDAAVRAAVGEL